MTALLIALLVASADEPAHIERPTLNDGIRPGWARVLVAAKPLQVGDIVREHDLYAVQVPPEDVPSFDLLAPQMAVGRRVAAPIFRNELMRIETLGEIAADPQRTAPSGSFLIHLDIAPPPSSLAAAVSGGCAVAPKIKVVATDPVVVAVPPEALRSVLTAPDLTLVNQGTVPDCTSP